MPQRQSQRCIYCHEPKTSTADVHSEYGAPMSLNLGSKVFLSHSGRDKDFVRRLYKELDRSYLGFGVAFFDEENLPKGKSINMEKSILEEAKQAKLGVLALTHDFFTNTKNPMLELEAFVAGNVDLLPLFLTMSVEEFQKEEWQSRWQRRWEEWAAADDKIVVEKWRSYLKVVKKFNGLEFRKVAPDQRWDLFIDEVVKKVARIIGPTISMCEQHVCGMNSMCQAVDVMYKTSSSRRSSLISSMPPQDASTSTNLGLLQNDYLCAYDVVGVYGFPGLGKTTLCYGLCDFYFGDMKGRVCYINVGDLQHNEVSRMECVLSRLDGGTTTNLRIDKNQTKNLLTMRLSSTKDPVFLAIDHLLPSNKSKDEALMYLQFPYPKGSKIFITSWTQSSLTNLISLLIPQHCSFSPVIENMPALDFEAATSIFKYGIPSLISVRAATDENLERDVRACVRMCTISDYGKLWFHPLMLMSLAAFVAHDESSPGLDHWEQRLKKVATEGTICKEGALERAFESFDINYGLLSENEQKVFLDLAICYLATYHSFDVPMNYYRWAKTLHLTDEPTAKQDFERILVKLQKLCYIERDSCGSKLSINSLMLEFAKHKADQRLAKSRDGCSNKYAYVVLKNTATRWPNGLMAARHVSIVNCKIKEPRTLDLRHVKGVEVLHLIHNEGLDEVLLSRKTTAQLRSMIVSPEYIPLPAALSFIVNKNCSMPSLKFLYLCGDVNFCLCPSLPSAARRDPGWKLDVGSFLNLEILHLVGATGSRGTLVQKLDLSRCASLKLLTVQSMAGLTSIRGPESSLLLAKVKIVFLEDLEELVFTVPADSKTRFKIFDCCSLQRLSLNHTPSMSSSSAGEPVVSSFKIDTTRNFKHFDGLSQYTGFVNYVFWGYHNETMSSPADEEMLSSSADQSGLRILEKLGDARVDLSQAKAKMFQLNLRASDSPGLGKVMCLTLDDAQHIGPLISAIFQARPTHLYNLSISCQQDGACFCDQNAPSFGDLPQISEDLEGKKQPRFHFSCPQVKDLTSLAKWQTLQFLCLEGCKSVEKWPNFALMTSLRALDLRNTSLRKWPAGLHLLPHLQELFLTSCVQLPAKELLLPVISTFSDSKRDAIIRDMALQNLWEDLAFHERDMHAVALALWELSVAEQVALSERWSRFSHCPKCIPSNIDRWLEFLWDFAAHTCVQRDTFRSYCRTPSTPSREW